jgi:hypothetical protein
MSRRHHDHVRRRVLDLHGIWDFAFLGALDSQAVDPRSIVFDSAMAGATSRSRRWHRRAPSSPSRSVRRRAPRT